MNTHLDRATWDVNFDIMKWSYNSLKSADAFRFTEAGATADQLLRLGVMPDDYFEGHGNLLLNEGVALLEDLLIGAAGTTFSNANAFIGVGDSSTAELATDTGLNAATNKLYKAMDATFPSRASQTVTWRSTFGTTDANFTWNEWTVANGSSNAATNLNHKTAAMGSKAAGSTWTLSVSVTIS